MHPTSWCVLPPERNGSRGFDAATRQLPPLRLSLWKGWIFITFNDQAPELAAHVAPLEKDFGYLRQEDCRLAVKTVSEVDCNWKLAVENLIDFYTSM